RELAEAAPAAATRPLDELRLLSPLPRPRQIRDFLCFEEHLLNVVEQMKQRGAAGALGIAPVWYQQPVFYTANALAVVGPDTEVSWPAYSASMDYELELACVIGRPGKAIPRERALEHVAGFTILNDLSARDAQMLEMPAGLGPGTGKDFDGGNVLGPWITTLDEIGDPQDLAMEVRVNGERWGGGTSAAMHHDFATMIAHVSRGSTLYPGEVLASGTVGTGCAFELGRELKSGDLVELEVERIGVLRTRVRREPTG
ncbi:MAG: fumarylacetoacetate hydrolase family protein, partial [Chloroflexi bacterium]|nr:fumarylacetoacetate hydrolase family protein [Chloroflexota bacterium]